MFSFFRNLLIAKRDHIQISWFEKDQELNDWNGQREQQPKPDRTVEATQRPERGRAQLRVRRKVRKYSLPGHCYRINRDASQQHCR